MITRQEIFRFLQLFIIYLIVYDKKLKVKDIVIIKYRENEWINSNLKQVQNN